MNGAMNDSGGNILIVDDTPDNLRLLSSLLSEAGYTVRKVLSGELGLEAAQLEPPDLILLDIVMPGMNGYEVCQRLKESDRTCHIPIIFLSALGEELEKVQAFQIGGVDYVTKPFQVVEVLVRIETHLKLSRLQIQLQQQNLRLQQEIEYRTAAESALQLLNQGIDARVQERTDELQTDKEQLLQLQIELQAALAKEQCLNELKSTLFTTLFQDLQTPLTVITSVIELLKQKESDRSESRNRHLKTLADNIKRINQAVQDASLLTGIETKNMLCNPVPLNLTQFCRSFVDQWQLPENSPHHITFIHWGKPPAQVYADPSLLQQILTHLVANAIQFSPNGGTILLELVYAATSVTVHIRDEGIGIPPEELERIFDRAYCASNVDAIAGSGMGLAIVKSIIERHAGTIVVSSELDKGSTFSVTLPMQNASVVSPNRDHA
ncbi:MAG: hybrid sensor histidine kinase/response regulator [Cyanobacteria bacterium CRU_2_1]|nr:hybrid sensor histidine kinase/response regulator [Cyanobacteria bacterium CRU_2_1]